jgi:protein gp37
VAGNGIVGYSGDGVSPTTTELNFPSGVFVDAQGDIFIADTANDAIREVVASTGLIQTVAGTPGTGGYNGDGIAATTAELSSPTGVYVDGSGNIYIADSGNSAIRVVNTGSSQITVAGITIPAGDIETVAGTPGTTCDEASSTTNCGDSGSATSAYLNFPNSIYLDSAGDIYIADTQDYAIREVSATGTIQTVAGTITTLGFSGDSGLATSAELDNPSGVWIDSSNDIFIADSSNAAVREVVAATGFIQTIAGTPANNGFGTPGFSGDGGPATSAELDYPSGVYGTTSGKLFIADTNNSRIRELGFNVAVAPSTAIVVINAIQQYTATVTGNPNTSVTWYVNQVQGGNSTVGTISTTGLFTAPATVPSSATVAITAVSQVDNTTSGTAQATIAVPSSTVTVTVTTTPTITQVNTGQTQPFIATVTGTSNTAVNWYVEGQQGGNATSGTIDTSGNYTAPANVPPSATVVIEAVSQADATAIGTESITIVAAPTAAPPSPQTISPGGTASYSLSLSGGSPSQPITLSCLQSSLPTGATCTFSPTSITPSSSPVPFSLSVTVPSGSAALQKPRGLWHPSPLYLAFLPLAGFLFIGGSTRSKRARWAWLGLLLVLLLGIVACSGGSGGTGSQSVTYTIKVQGATAAQPNPITITTVSLTVQ